MVTGRFAPSPSGRMHLGNARTALLAWLDARSRGGRMLLRIEDLDRDRCRTEFADAVRDDLRWMGLDWDEEAAPQSTRGEAYRAAVERLAADGLVYDCFCSRRELALASAPHGTGGERRYPGTCARLSVTERAGRIAAGARPALRLRMPAEPVSFTDRVRGRVAESVAATAGDIAVRRSDGLHSYQLAVVVDDAADGVTDVVRGDDLLSSTARQIALQRLLDLPVPRYAHVPLVLAPDGERLAKRRRPATLADLRAAGVRSADVVGALAVSAGLVEPGTSAEPAELVDGFRLVAIARVPVVLDAGDRTRAAS